MPVGGARQITASFAAGYSGCTAQVIRGVEEGRGSMIADSLIRPGTRIESTAYASLIGTEGACVRDALDPWRAQRASAGPSAGAVLSGAAAMDAVPGEVSSPWTR